MKPDGVLNINIHRKFYVYFTWEYC